MQTAEPKDVVPVKTALQPTFHEDMQCPSCTQSLVLNTNDTEANSSTKR